VEVRRTAVSEDAVIEIEGLRKEFLLSHSGVGSVKTLLLWWNQRKVERLEVLKGIDLRVGKGEAVAVIGRNGAGKSTLLSLVARVYKPTSGTITVRGRVAPLLELGAGFHPDLTGIENVFFNGIILGLSRRQMRQRLDEIIDFSELRHQIDSPVRTYSSGMMARLGFAVATHVDAEALLVDEVLAVGDLEFEQKCYRKIADFKASGGAILFVSHNMEAVRRVADRCVWLEDGAIKMSGTAEEVTAHYEASAVQTAARTAP
jgi:ABC-type polysaccharide/polyol phosphate transport system ATPase subunit